MAQRWFASKSREVASLNVLEAVPLRDEVPLLVLALVEARFPAGTHEVYQVPIGLRPASEGWEERVIASADDWTVYDGLADPALARELLHHMRASQRRPDRGGPRSRSAGPSRSARSLADDVEVRPMGVEQSNSSVVFGDALVLKVFRRVEPGINPELELLRFLSSRGFPHIAPLAGWYEYEGRLIDATLGILQEFLADGRDGWELALDELAVRSGRVPRARRRARNGHGRDAHRARLRGPGSRLRSRRAFDRVALAADRHGRRADRADLRRLARRRGDRGDRGPRAGRSRAAAGALLDRGRRQGHPHPRRLPPGPDHVDRPRLGGARLRGRAGAPAARAAAQALAAARRGRHAALVRLRRVRLGAPARARRAGGLGGPGPRRASWTPTSRRSTLACSRPGRTPRGSC